MGALVVLLVVVIFVASADLIAAAMRSAEATKMATTRRITSAVMATGFRQ